MLEDEKIHPFLNARVDTDFTLMSGRVRKFALFEYQRLNPYYLNRRIRLLSLLNARVKKMPFSNAGVRLSLPSVNTPPAVKEEC